jgi:hypothetical protein
MSGLLPGLRSTLTTRSQDPTGSGVDRTKPDRLVCPSRPWKPLADTLVQGPMTPRDDRIQLEHGHQPYTVWVWGARRYS